MTQSRPRATRSRLSCTLEERLHRAHDQFVLLADVFELHAVAPEYLQGETLSAPAARALTASCRQAADDMRHLLHILPVDLVNWAPVAARARPQHERQARRAHR